MYSNNVLEVGNDLGGKGLKLDYFNQNAINPNNSISINNGSATEVSLNNQNFKLVPFAGSFGNKWKTNKKAFAYSEKKENEDGASGVAATAGVGLFELLIPGIGIILHSLEAGKAISDSNGNKLVINQNGNNINPKDAMNPALSGFVSTPMNYKLADVDSSGLELWQKRRAERALAVSEEKKEKKSKPLGSMGGKRQNG